MSLKILLPWQQDERDETWARDFYFDRINSDFYPEIIVHKGYLHVYFLSETQDLNPPITVENAKTLIDADAQSKGWYLL